MRWEIIKRKNDDTFIYGTPPSDTINLDEEMMKINNIQEENHKILNSKDFFMTLFKFINKPNKDDFHKLLNYISSFLTSDKNLEENNSLIHLNFLKSFIKNINQG